MEYMIYHVTTLEEWERDASYDSYAPTAFDREQFIHTCHPHQLKGVLQRYFSGKTNLILLTIDEEKVSVPLKHEPGTGGDLFPHIYGRINKNAIVKMEKTDGAGAGLSGSFPSV